MGLSLEIGDLPDSFPLKESVSGWHESGFWQEQVEPGVWRANVGATLPSTTPREIIDAISIAGCDSIGPTRPVTSLGIFTGVTSRTSTAITLTECGPRPTGERN